MILEVSGRWVCDCVSLSLSLSLRFQPNNNNNNNPGTLEKLIRLNCSNCKHVDDDAIALFLSHRPYPSHLNDLNLSGTSITYVSVNLLGVALADLTRVLLCNVKDLNDGSCVRTLTRSNRNLLELDLSDTNIQSESEILSIGEFCSNLRSLNLRGLRNLESKTLRILARGLIRLEILKCENLNLVAKYFSSLKSNTVPSSRRRDVRAELHLRRKREVHAAIIIQSFVRVTFARRTRLRLCSRHKRRKHSAAVEIQRRVRGRRVRFAYLDKRDKMIRGFVCLQRRVRRRRTRKLVFKIKRFSFRWWCVFIRLRRRRLVIQRRIMLGLKVYV